MEKIIWISEFERFKREVSKYHAQKPGYPCKECIVSVCCSLICREFKTWIEQMAEETNLV